MTSTSPLITRVDRLDADQRDAVAHLLAAVIHADDHRGVGGNVLEILADQEPAGDKDGDGDAFAVLATSSTPTAWTYV